MIKIMFGFKKIRGKENREEKWKERKKKKKKIQI